jgi:hypothetical protein
MDLYDKKLLNKQFQWLYPDPNGVSNLLAVAAGILFIGFTIGAFFPYAIP